MYIYVYICMYYIYINMYICYIYMRVCVYNYVYIDRLNMHLRKLINEFHISNDSTKVKEIMIYFIRSL